MSSLNVLNVSFLSFLLLSLAIWLLSPSSIGATRCTSLSFPATLYAATIAT